MLQLSESSPRIAVQPLVSCEESALALTSPLPALGTAIAKAKLSLVYGGGTYGLMGLVSDAVLEGGCSVTGIIPRSISISGSEGTPKEDSYANANKRPTLKEV